MPCFKNFFLHLYCIVAFFPAYLFAIVIPSLVCSGYKYSTQILDTPIILGALPVPCFQSFENVKAVLSLNFWYEIVWFLCCQNWKMYGIKYLRIPVMDHFGTPSLQQIVQALTFIEENTKKNEKIYIHCKGGKGRSTMIVLCYLIWNNGMTPEQAHEHVKKCRHQINVKGIKWDTVNEFYKSDELEELRKLSSNMNK